MEPDEVPSKESLFSIILVSLHDLSESCQKQVFAPTLISRHSYVTEHFQLSQFRIFIPAVLLLSAGTRNIGLTNYDVISDPVWRNVPGSPVFTVVWINIYDRLFLSPPIVCRCAKTFRMRVINTEHRCTMHNKDKPEFNSEWFLPLIFLMSAAVF